MTDLTGGQVVRALLVATSSLMAITLAAPVVAQTVDVGPPQTPLNDTDCDFNNPTASREVPPCTVDGTRGVTYDGRTREVRTPTADSLIDRYQVDFAGRLAVDGTPVTSGPSPVFPFGGAGPRDASDFFFDPDNRQIVDVTASYTGERIQSVSTGGAGTAPQANPAYWSRVSNLATTVNSIDIDIAAFADTSDGNGYDFTLASIDPTAIVNNGTAVRGSFKSDDDNRSIQFGTLSGTATLTGGYQVTPYPDNVGANNTGLLSLYQLVYDVTAIVTTQLDETGLIAPRVIILGLRPAVGVGVYRPAGLVQIVKIESRKAEIALDHKFTPQSRRSDT